MTMQLALHLDFTSRVSLRDQLVGQLRTSIAAGRIKPGSRLPGTRALSRQLGVSRNTILLAYDGLASEGYVESREGAGTYVSVQSPEQHQFVQTAAPYRCRSGRPAKHKSGLLDADGRVAAPTTPPDFDFELEGMDPDVFPGNVWRRLLTRRVRSSNFNLTRNEASRGLRSLREALCGFLGATRGMTVDADQIVIVTSIQQALNVVGRLLVRPGTSVITEAPGCSLIAGLYESYGGRNVPVLADDQGLKVEQLPDCREGLVLATPSRHFPLGGVMSTARRQALLEWAARTGSHVVDVDFDSDFRYQGSPPPSLQTLDRDSRFIYTGSFAMTIGPGLRIGYMVVPHHLLDGAIHATRLLDYGFPCHGVPWLDQAVLTDFIASGGYDKHLRLLRRHYLERRDCLIESLRAHFGEVDLRGLASGTHLTWRLSEEFASATRCSHLAQAENVAVYTLKSSTSYGTECIVAADCLSDWDRYLLLGFASMKPPAISEAVRRLARAIA